MCKNWPLTQGRRKHVVFDPQVVKFLEDYQVRHRLPSFSAAVEAAAAALRHQELKSEYERFAHEYAADPTAQAEAEAWLGLSMQEQE
ncbi:hypothetical protein Dxin01_03475 [Deinococcus xinjiangensis]|uniref:CopG family transcriptional regulator n=1 Tax=Deinococcus xinjiangensis TaxID=457454 RepID=A0ABP9VEP5_9DEIO